MRAEGGWLEAVLVVVVVVANVKLDSLEGETFIARRSRLVVPILYGETA